MAPNQEPPPLRLDTGSRLGPYTIVAPLGAGGMGEVYRATDSRLGREVAIKVLPEAVASDPARLRRFEQEARAASALNHANVLVVYDVGREGSTAFLVTELLEGRTLRAVLDGGEPMALRRLLEWGEQIARGLAAAHERGIVHRDIKPENLFVTRDGVVKILDFGLAKLSRADDPSLAVAPTLAGEATGTGTVVGTAGYMAPEQVRGEHVDVRTDLFALGCVLYELLGGARAFGGSSAIEILSAILRDEPTPLATLRADLSPELVRTVERCLAKSPNDRWQSARDLAYRLQELRDGGGSGEAAGISPSPPARADRGTAARFLPWSLAALALALAAALAFRAAGPRAAAKTPVWQRVTFRRGVPLGGRFASDGRTILYSEAFADGASHVYSTRLDSPQSSTLPLPASTLLAVSSSEQIALLLARGDRSTLAVAALAGGGAREVLDGVSAADFSPDGKRLAVVHELTDRQVIESPPGTMLYDPGPRVTLRDLRFSPQGDRVAVLEDRGNGSTELLTVDLEGRRSSISTGWADAFGLAWNPSSGEIWYTARATGTAGGLVLHASTPGGATRLVLTVPGVIRIQDVLPDGKVLLLHSQWPETLVCQAPGATHETDLTWLDYSVVRDISDDGRTVLIWEAGLAEGGSGAVYLRGTDGGDAVRLGDGEPLALSRDGKWVLVRSNDTPRRWSLLPTGAGNPQPLAVAEGNIRSAEFLPDSKALLLRVEQPGAGTRVYRRSLAGGALEPIGTQDFAIAALSPDGRFAVGRDGEGWHQFTLDGSATARPLPGLAADDIVLRFDGSGRELFVTKDQLPIEVRRFQITSGRSTPLHRLGPDLPRGVRDDNVALAADGRAYCYSYLRDISDLYLVTGLE